MRKLKLLEFIKKNENWRELLSGEPYFIKITTEGKYTMFKYNQLNSDFNNEIVRECRGLILDDKFEPVCVPFFKFGNYGESYCPEIDWSTARVQEKIDGSITKLWNHDGKWHVSTNGMIDAYTADLSNDARLKHNPFKTFGELFDVAAKNSALNYDKLDKGNTYMFELTSPFNQVIVPYEGVHIHHIGTRNNRTLEELDIDIGVQKPKNFAIKTLEDCIKAASELPFDEEGYVVVDKNFNRVKIKSPKYVMAAHVRNNGVVTTNRLIEIIRKNEIEEFLLYCGEYKDTIHSVQQKINEVINRLDDKYERLSGLNFSTQKEFALHVKDDVDNDFLFMCRANAMFSAHNYVKRLIRDKEIENFALQIGVAADASDKQKTIDEVTHYLEGKLSKFEHLRSERHSDFLLLIKDDAARGFLEEWHKKVNFSAKEYVWNLRNEQIERLIENV